MSTQSDLPSFDTEEYDALCDTVRTAVQQGDVDTLKQVPFVTLHRMNDEAFFLFPEALAHRQLPVLVWLAEESLRTGLDVAFGWKCVHVASLLGNLDKLKAVSDEELMQKTRREESVLHAAALGDQAEVVEYLVRERGFDVLVEDVEGETALDAASQHGCLSTIEALVAYGASLRRCGELPCRALREAVYHGQIAAMQRLVELGADIGTSGNRSSIVHTAVLSNRADVVECAVRLGADPGAVDSRGQSPLHRAAEFGRVGVMKRLVQLGVPLDSRSSNGCTPLHLSAVYRSPQASRRLLELGADRWIKDNEGCTPRDVALADPYDDGREDVATILDTYFPIVPSMTQLLLGLRGPTPSSLTRLAANSAFEPKVLSLVNCLLVGKEDEAFRQLLVDLAASHT